MHHWQDGYKITVIFLILILAINLARAATPTPAEQAQGTVNPSRVGEFLAAPTQQPAYSAKAPTIESPEKPQPLIAGAEKIKFKLTKVIINGTNVYPPQALQAIFQPYYDKEISLAKLLELVDQVTNKYRNEGYVLSKAYLPPQEIKGGIVTINVIEGFIDQVRVSGRPRGVARIVLDYGKRAQEDVPLQMDNLERYMLLMNDLPGTNVKAVLQPSKTKTSAADLDLITQFYFLQASVAYDNFNSRYLGPRDITLSTQLNSLIRSGDMNLLRAITGTSTREMKYFQFLHDEPMGSAGLHGLLGGYYTQTNPGSSLEDLDVVGRSKFAYFGVTYPIIRSRSQNLSLQSTFNYSNTVSTLLDAPFYNDRVRYFSFNGSYERADSWRGVNALSLGFQQGLDILHASEGGDLSRPHGHSNFNLITFNVMRLQGIVKHITMFFAAQGQTTVMPLLSGQQFGFGGPDFGRGYDPSEIVGDRGLAGKAEFRVDATPDWYLLQTAQFYVFYDIGGIWNMDTSNQVAKNSATSTGFGVRYTIFKRVNGQLYFAKPLTHKVASLVAVGQSGEAMRGFFSISLAVE